MEHYQISIHYALAAQRQIFRSELYRALRAAEVPGGFAFSNWVRIGSYRYSHRPLSAYGSTIGAGGRFNYGDAIDSIDARPFPAFYIASNEQVAYREYFGVSRHGFVGLSRADFALMRENDHVLVHLNGKLTQVVDVTRPTKLAKLAKVLSQFTVSKEVSELAKLAAIPPRQLVADVNQLLLALREQNWRGWSRQHGLPASCQIFGKLAWEAGFEAIRYRSTKAGGECLAVFPENFDRSDAQIALANPAPPGVVDTLDATNWTHATQP